MRIQPYTTLLCTLLVCGGCVIKDDPPAMPDAARFVPPAITLPVDEKPLASVPPLASATVVSVTLPPREALPTVVDRASVTPSVRARGKQGNPLVEDAIAGSLLTPTRGGFADNTSAILHYPYRTGAVYYVPTSPAHATSLVLPPGVVLAANPVIDDNQWEVQGAKMQLGEDLQFAVVVKPKEPGIETTMQLFSTTGHLFLIRLVSQHGPGVLAVQFELPLLQIISGSRQAETQAPTEAGPKIDVSRLHTQYRIDVQGKNAVAWTPVEAYDDGRLTVVRFAESLEYTSAPVLMAVSPDGKKTLPLEYITYQVPGRKDKGEFYLTKGLYPRLRLMDATKGTVDIVRLPTPAPPYVESYHAPR